MTTSILELERNCFAVAEVTEAGLLVDGSDYYRAFFEAARLARRQILMVGWQFDSEVELLRGDDARRADRPVRLLPFLDDLCNRNRALEIAMLAWDYSFVYASEREALQRWMFNWPTNGRLRFRLDGNHSIGASQHQKFVVIDGSLAFAGGTDICASRWDDRRHRANHPLRAESNGERYGPYHEVQAYLRGPAVRELVEVFRDRWRIATGEEPHVAEPSPLPPLRFEGAISLPFRRVALSRTGGRMWRPPRSTITEILEFYRDAIRSAERTVYIENQFFTSEVVRTVLVERMEDPSRSRLDVILVLPRQAGAMKEELALGRRQASLMRDLERVARAGGHRFGAYFTVAADGEEELPVYIHSKVLIVDDRLLSVGSANTTNRSLGLDTELNLAFEARTRSERESVRSVLTDLLAEHCGLDQAALLHERHVQGGWVPALDRIGHSRRGRLRLHPRRSVLDDSAVLDAILPEDVAFDPSRPVEENLDDLFGLANGEGFASGIAALRRWLESRTSDPEPSESG